MTPYPEAEFVGGPNDGEVLVIRRNSDGVAPDSFTMVSVDPAWREGEDHEPIPTILHIYRLRADVGPRVVYDYERVRHSRQVK